MKIYYLKKIKQQTNGKTANKLTRVAKGSEVITWTYLEKQKVVNEEILRRSQSTADNEKPGSSGIQSITKNTKTKYSRSTKEKGIGKKTKTTKQSNNSKTEKIQYDIKQNTGSSELQKIDKKPENSAQNQNYSTSSGKGKGVGKKTKTTKQTNLKTEKDLDDKEQNKLIKTSKRKKETKESKRITKANPSKKIKRSPSIASTFVDSDEISFYSDSDLQNLPSDFFTDEELIMSTIPNEKEELLQREQEIERILKEY